MPSTLEIRRRIKSIRSTAKITHSMELIAASKLRKAEEAAKSSRDYKNNLILLLGKLLSIKKLAHPFLKTKSKPTSLFIVVTSNRGLAGAYNLNVIKKVLEIKESGQEKEIRLITIGKKGESFFAKAGFNIIATFYDLPLFPFIYEVKPISRIAMEEYLSGQVSEVKIFYTRYSSAVSVEPVSATLLPLNLELLIKENFETEMEKIENLFSAYQLLPPLIEPDYQTLFDLLLKKLISEQIYQAFLEAVASEQAARMLAMRNATEAAEEIIEDLTLTYNSIRQSAITKELAEIISASETI